MIVKKVFTIAGMHCTSCAMNIDFDLEDIDGVTSAQTNYAKAQTEVEFNTDKITTAEVISQIQKTGYLASE